MICHISARCMVVFTGIFYFGALTAAALEQLPVDAPHRAWDFSSPWQVIGGQRVGQDPHGIIIQQKSNGPVLRNQTLDFRALDVSACEITLSVSYPTPGGSVLAAPASVRLYWARQADVKHNPEWPFDGGRSALMVPDGDRERVYVADVGMHGNWIGTIRDAFIEVHGPEEAVATGVPWQVRVESAHLRSSAEKAGEWTAQPGEDMSPVPDGPPERVLFVLIDTLRADHLGYMGYGRDTSPWLDQLASESANFRFTIAHGDGTVYSMPAVFTGKYYSQLHADPPWEAGIPEESITIGELFQDAGFRTVAWSTNPHISKRRMYDQGFDVFHELWPDGIIYSRIEHVIRSVRRNYRRESDREFLYLHLMDVHHPYFPPAPYCDMWASPYNRNTFQNGSMRGFDNREAIGLHPYWAESHDVTREDIDQAMAQYDGEIRYVDTYLPELLDALQYDPGRDLLIVTSDHGEQFYEHGFIGHNKSTLLEEIHVPLLIRYPGHDPRSIDTPVGLVDILPTMCDLYEMPVPGGVQGRSLLPAIAGGELDPRPLYSEASPMRGVVSVVIDSGWLYYLNLRANVSTRPWDPWPIRQLLFCVEDDPGCQTDLAGLEPGRLVAMNELLREINPRLKHATPGELPFPPETAPLEKPDAAGPLEGEGPLISLSLAFADPRRQYLLEVDYCLDSGHVRLEGSAQGNGQSLLEYGFYRPRPEGHTFRTVLNPGVAKGLLHFDARSAEGFVITGARCEPIISPLIPVEPWPGSAASIETAEELTEEEKQRFEALGYVQ